MQTGKRILWIPFLILASMVTAAFVIVLYAIYTTPELAKNDWLKSLAIGVYIGILADLALGNGLEMVTGLVFGTVGCLIARLFYFCWPLAVLIVILICLLIYRIIKKRERD